MPSRSLEDTGDQTPLFGDWTGKRAEVSFLSCKSCKQRGLNILNCFQDKNSIYCIYLQCSCLFCSWFANCPPWISISFRAEVMIIKNLKKYFTFEVSKVMWTFPFIIMGRKDLLSHFYTKVTSRLASVLKQKCPKLLLRTVVPMSEISLVLGGL